MLHVPLVLVFTAAAGLIEIVEVYMPGEISLVEITWLLVIVKQVFQSRPHFDAARFLNQFTRRFY